jgi:hypothetical protein
LREKKKKERLREVKRREREEKTGAKREHNFENFSGSQIHWSNLRMWSSVTKRFSLGLGFNEENVEDAENVIPVEKVEKSKRKSMMADMIIANKADEVISFNEPVNWKLVEKDASLTDRDMEAVKCEGKRLTIRLKKVATPLKEKTQENQQSLPSINDFFEDEAKELPPMERRDRPAKSAPHTPNTHKTPRTPASKNNTPKVVNDENVEEQDAFVNPPRSRRKSIKRQSYVILSPDVDDFVESAPSSNKKGRTTDSGKKRQTKLIMDDLEDDKVEDQHFKPGKQKEESSRPAKSASQTPRTPRTPASKNTTPKRKPVLTPRVEQSNTPLTAGLSPIQEVHENQVLPSINDFFVDEKYELPLKKKRGRPSKGTPQTPRTPASKNNKPNNDDNVEEQEAVINTRRSGRKSIKRQSYVILSPDMDDCFESAQSSSKKGKTTTATAGKKRQTKLTMEDLEDDEDDDQPFKPGKQDVEPSSSEDEKVDITPPKKRRGRPSKSTPQTPRTPRTPASRNNTPMRKLLMTPRVEQRNTPLTAVLSPIQEAQVGHFF